MNSRWREITLAMVLVTSSSLVVADTSHTQIEETRQSLSSPDTTPLTATDRARANAWGLSEQEWRRYKTLMQGIRGSISPPTISPIEVLGIHARDEVERRKYAERWARAMREDVDRILAFQRAYDAAGKRLFPNERLIDVDRLPRKTERKDVLQVTDRVLFFSRPDCPSCDLLLGKLLNRIDEIAGIDIYLSGIEPGDDAAVRDWASAHEIDPKWVRSRRITLNHDAGALEKLTKGEGKAPYVLRRRGDDLSPIRASDL